jgi:hypothetical protein
VQLYEIGVVERLWKRGVGRALLTAFRDLAVAEGHRRMWLVTDEDNAAAKALYETTGGEPSLHDDAGYWWQLDAAEPAWRRDVAIGWHGPINFCRVDGRWVTYLFGSATARSLWISSCCAASLEKAWT